jgi:hypothetical protein
MSTHLFSPLAQRRPRLHIFDWTAAKSACVRSTAGWKTASSSSPALNTPSVASTWKWTSPREVVVDPSAKGPSCGTVVPGPNF